MLRGPRMTSVRTKPVASTSRLREMIIAAPRALWWAPALFAGAYLVTLAVQFNELLASSYLNADAASAPVIGELFGDRGAHALVLLGHLAWYSTLLFELVTRWMPLHRQIWEAAPYAMVLCSAGLVGWGAWRVAGRWAGMIAAVIVICAGPTALSWLFVLNDHAPTWSTLALLGAFVVLLEQRADTISSRWLAALAVVVGVVLGANAASDVLLTISGGIPFVLAVGCAWVLGRDRRTARAGAFAVVSVVSGIVSGLVLHAVAHHLNVIAATDPRANLLVAEEAVATNFKLWWQSIALLGDGDFFGQTLGFSSAVSLLCAGMAIGAVLLVPRIAHSELTRDLAARRRGAREPASSARVAWCVFWAASLVLLSLAFILSDTPDGLAASHYLVGLLYAAAALVPLLGGGGRPMRVVVTAGVTLYAFTGWLALAQHRIGPRSSPSYQLAAAVERIANEEHLSVGYAGYWDAAPITWATHLRVKVFPVEDCDGNQHLCVFELHLISSWYTPRPDTKTFLLSDSDPAYSGWPSAPTPDLGKPIAVHQIGAVTMYVYPYDIASRLSTL
jgi:hypothetical protein